MLIVGGGGVGVYGFGMLRFRALVLERGSSICPHMNRTS